MKLILSKDQSQAMVGGVRFELEAQVELSDEEAQLIKHYKLDNEVLFQKTMVNLWGQSTDHMIDVRVKNLLGGQRYSCKSLDEVIGYANSVVSACETLKAYLKVARGFGGKEIFVFGDEASGAALDRGPVRAQSVHPAPAAAESVEDDAEDPLEGEGSGEGDYCLKCGQPLGERDTKCGKCGWTWS